MVQDLVHRAFRCRDCRPFDFHREIVLVPAVAHFVQEQVFGTDEQPGFYIEVRIQFFPSPPQFDEDFLCDVFRYGAVPGDFFDEIMDLADKLVVESIKSLYASLAQGSDGGMKTAEPFPVVHFIAKVRKKREMTFSAEYFYLVGCINSVVEHLSN